MKRFGSAPLCRIQRVECAVHAPRDGSVGIHALALGGRVSVEQPLRVGQLLPGMRVLAHLIEHALAAKEEVLLEGRKGERRGSCADEHRSYGQHLVPPDLVDHDPQRGGDPANDHDAAELQAYEEGDEPDEVSSSSVDEQIDKLLLQYEKLSVPDEEQALQEMINKGSLRFILEQEEPEEEAEEEEAVEDPDEEAAEAEEEADAPEEEAPSIDIGTFAAKVARLAEMPEKVLDLKSAIIDRAVQYLQENYDDNVAKDFEEALLDRFQMAVPETEIENLVAADLPAPPAVGAGSGGAAGG